MRLTIKSVTRKATGVQRISHNHNNPLSCLWYSRGARSACDSALGAEPVQTRTRKTAIVGHGVLRYPLALVLIVCSFALLASSAAATNFTWSGTATAGEAKWSNGTNWEGTAPSGSVGTLTFPELGGTCATEHPTATCYTSENNVSGLAADSIAIDSAVPYDIFGNAITLGAGGLTANGAATVSGGSIPDAQLDVPITLGAPQTWSIKGVNGVFIPALTGSTQALHLNLSNEGSLALGDTEIGPVTVKSEGFSEFGLVMTGTSLNGTDGNPVSLSGGAGLAVTASSPSEIGPLTISGGGLLIGQGVTPDATLAVNGGVTLDSESMLRLDIDQSGATPGADYSQLTASGTVKLAGATLAILGSDYECPSLAVGETDTLVMTTGTLEGTFAGVPNGGTVALDCFGRSPLVRINYAAHAVTATVVPAHQLAVSLEGSGEGKVSGEEINCNTIGEEPDVCNKSFPAGATVTLTASPYPGSMFTGWSGACTGTGSCVVTMGSDQAVTASFAPASTTCPTGQTGTPPDCNNSVSNSSSSPVASLAQVNGPPAVPAPVLTQRETASLSSGTVTIRPKGTSTFVPLSGSTSIPDESEVEATNGRVVITVATPKGGTATAEVYGGRFRIHQDSSGETVFILTLPLTGCPRVALPHGSAAALARAGKRQSGPTSRHLWVSESGGSWGTNGRYVSTTVEGTKWLTLDECTKSEVKVTAGKVEVLDLVRKKTKTLTAGHSYVAAAQRGRRA